MKLNYSQQYWNKVANEKTFTHPLNISFLEKFVSKDSCIVDYGCGYGRIVKELNDNAFNDVKGFDFSVELINRGHKIGVENIFQIDSASDLPIENNSVDCFLLFAVLTCIPGNKSQMELIEILFSKLKTGGIIYISDYYLQTNSVEVNRYKYLNDDIENYGVFTLPDGATFRHHSKVWIKELLKDFRAIHEKSIEVKTMNGNSAAAFQIIAKK
ncbi:MAG: hypothetical protein RL708_2285 [Bacteroidota bacterium]|jgi:SAM-dependent methyltransferase